MNEAYTTGAEVICPLTFYEQIQLMMYNLEICCEHAHYATIHNPAVTIPLQTL